MASAGCSPEIGEWYRDIQNRIFGVVAIDDDDTIEVQYYDGDVAEYDRETWDLLCMNIISEPNDGLGPYEDINDEDTNILNENFQPVSWDNVVGDFEIQNKQY